MVDFHPLHREYTVYTVFILDTLKLVWRWNSPSPKIHMNICCTWCNTTLTQLSAQVMMLPRKPMIAKTKPRIRLQPAVMMKLSWWFFLKAAEKTSAGSGWIWVPRITFFTLYSEPHLCITNLSAFLVITIVLNYRLSVSNYQCDVVGLFNFTTL